jgi:precorrin-2 dehydrogenase/sirohydrochlorin ferrochelatase
MKYYPIFLDMKGRNCLVVGGGRVGARKAATLERCGANVTIVSERFSSGCDNLRSTGICLEKKKYEREDLRGMSLVFAATDDADLNQRIKRDAQAFNILCNVADAPDNSDFLVPSTIDRGDLVLAISTSGSSPAMAKKIRQDLEQRFGPEYALFLEFMGNIRKRLLASGHAPEEHKQVFHTLIDRGILALIQQNDEMKINELLIDILGDVPGKNYSYQDLVRLRSDE